jgi:anti-anti-sigma factor
MRVFSTDLSTRSCDGHAVVALRGELDVADAVAVAAALGSVATREAGIIVDLAGLKFIDSSGVAALVRGRRQAWEAGGDLILAAPQQTVMRVLDVIRLADAFSIYATVEEAAEEAGRFRGRDGPPPRPRGARWPRAVMWSRARAPRSPQSSRMSPTRIASPHARATGAATEGNTDVSDARTGPPQ